MAGFGTTAFLITMLIAALVVVPGLLASRGGRVGRVFRSFGKAGGEVATSSPPAQARITSARFCTECGSGLNANAAFCTQCGTRV